MLYLYVERIIVIASELSGAGCKWYQLCDQDSGRTAIRKATKLDKVREKNEGGVRCTNQDVPLEHVEKALKFTFYP